MTAPPPPWFVLRGHQSPVTAALFYTEEGGSQTISSSDTAAAAPPPPQPRTPCLITGDGAGNVKIWGTCLHAACVACQPAGICTLVVMYSSAACGQAWCTLKFTFDSADICFPLRVLLNGAPTQNAQSL